MCHIWHATEHYSPDLKLKFKDYQTIVLKYESLKTDENAHVRYTSYKEARRFVENGNESKLTPQIKEADQKN